MSTEEDALKHDVAYLRFLVTSGLKQEEIREIAKIHAPYIEVCFSEEEAMQKAESLERGKHLVLIS
ncbi:MAG: hypothetical protein OK441_06825 [Thaumarchaeota archaeon]|nr:hypothetical protein [Nitrososphaerota archaeon]